jgi:hypothetical protein
MVTIFTGIVIAAGIVAGVFAVCKVAGIAFEKLIRR